MNPSVSNAALTGGKPVDVEYQERLPSGDPKIETIFVRQIKASQVNDYIASQADEAKLASILTGRDLKWVDSITYESLVRITDAGEEINDPNVSLLVARRARREASLGAVIAPLAKARSANG